MLRSGGQEKDGWRARGEGYTGGEQSNPSLFDTNSRPNPPLSGQCAWIALHLVLLGAVNSGMVGGIGILFLPPPFRRSSGSWWRRKEMVSQFRKGQCSSGSLNKGVLLPSSVVRTSISVPFIGEIPPFHRIHIPSIAFLPLEYLNRQRNLAVVTCSATRELASFFIAPFPPLGGSNRLNQSLCLVATC